MMKIYLYDGMTRQYEEGKQPDGAVEVKPNKPEEKAKKTVNKAAKAPANKSKKAAKK